MSGSLRSYSCKETEVVMFRIGDYVVYENNGICEIKDITDLKDAGMAPERMYYLMVPINEKSSKIYVATDSSNNRMRNVLSSDEASALIDEIPGIEELKIDNEKQREKCYQEIIRSSDCRELARVVKTLYFRRRKRLSEGKKSTVTDEKYFKIAEKNLYDELAFATGRKPEEIREIIAEKAQNK